MDPIDRIFDELVQTEKPPGRPLVTLSYAQSLDGCITARRGYPQALSGAESTRMTHRLRAAHDVIVVGIGTVLADDPQLTVRLVEGNDPQPLVLDSYLRFPLEAKLLLNRSPWIATTPQVDRNKAEILEGRGVVLMYLPVEPSGGISLPAVLERLGQGGVKRVMVEGGARVITSFLAARLVDYLVLTVAPVLVGGFHAVERLLADLDQPTIASFPRLKSMSTFQLGTDLIVWGRVTDS